MMRKTRIRGAGGGLVAIYDALLFLMVVILISVGMFLYSAKSASMGVGLSNGFQEERAERQLIAVEGVAVHNIEVHPVGDPTNTTPLTELVEPDPDMEDIAWLLDAYCALWYLNEENGSQWDLGFVEANLTENFTLCSIKGFHYAWAFILEEEVVMFDSDNITSLDELPDERWAASREYPRRDLHVRDIEGPIEVSAELVYYLWEE